jgi:hypothetical protein
MESLSQNGIVWRFKERNKKVRNLHPIPVIACGPGTGKSNEIETLLKRNINDSKNEGIQKYGRHQHHLWKWIPC